MTRLDKRTSIDDPWVYFWGKYMVWSIRICCYCSNLYFFSVIRETLRADNGNHYIIDYAIAGYSLLCLILIERLMWRVYRPGFISEEEASQLDDLPVGKLVLTERDYEYRLLGEITIWTSVAFVLFNLAVAVIIGDIIDAANSDNLIIGIFAGIVSFLSTIVGVVGMVAESPSGNRSIIAHIFGFVFLVPPAVYIFHTVSKFGLI